MLDLHFRVRKDDPGSCAATCRATAKDVLEEFWAAPPTGSAQVRSRPKGGIPVGFALPKSRVTPNLDSEKQRFRRFGSIPSSKSALWLLALQFAPTMLTKMPIVLQTEQLGGKPFHGRVSLLVDRHTASAAEMIVALARENNLAKIVGEKTAGRLLSATSVKVGQGLRLALPTGAYYTWKGTVLEGTTIEPDQRIGFDWQQRGAGIDVQLNYAIDGLCNRESTTGHLNRKSTGFASSFCPAGSPPK